MRAGTAEKLGSGLLVSDADAERAGKPVERRIEEWVVSNLEGRSCKTAGSIWEEMLGNRAGLRRLSKKEERQAAKDGDWGRFRLSERKGVATIRLTDTMLLKEQIIQEFSDDLLELVAAGYDRVILNFADVERLSVQVVLGLAEAHRQCMSALGGSLKLCGLRAEIAEGLELTGLSDELEIYPDEATAQESPWPFAGEFRPLPVNMLSFLRLYTGSDQCGGATEMTGAGSENPASSSKEKGTEFRLIVESGQAAGRSLQIGRRRLLIGREAGCALRVVSSTVSRIHASIEIQGGRLLLQDLDSTNGTHWNEKLVQSETVELHDGDQITVGPLQLRVRCASKVCPSVPVEREIIDWVRQDDLEAGEISDRDLTADDLPVPTQIDTENARSLSVEVIQDILVLTPLHSDLNDEPQIGPLRAELQGLSAGTGSRRVVVCLKNVAHVSSQAIGILVAYTLKLEREGGELRLSQICPRVMAVLNQIRLPMLIEIYPTTDEAVLCAWRKPLNSSNSVAV